MVFNENQRMIRGLVGCVPNSQNQDTCPSHRPRPCVINLLILPTGSGCRLNNMYIYACNTHLVNGVSSTLFAISVMSRYAILVFVNIVAVLVVVAIQNLYSFTTTSRDVSQFSVLPQALISNANNVFSNATNLSKITTHEMGQKIAKHDALAKSRIIGIDHEAYDRHHTRYSGITSAQFQLPLSDVKITAVDGIATHGWWRDAAAGKWEPHTFRALNQEVRRGMIYVGFGEWVGVTGLFAAQRVKMAILMDADPRAYEEMRANVLLNRAAFGNIIETDPRCISSSRGKVLMHGNGGSGSSISGAQWAKSMPVFEVDCLPLPDLLKDYGLSTDRHHLFIKIDTEGAESLIVPSLHDWVAAAPKRPTIFLSMHDSSNTSQLEAIATVLNMFRFYAIIPGRTDENIGTSIPTCVNGIPLQSNAKNNFFTASKVCRWCDYLLVDDDSRAAEMCPVEQARLNRKLKVGLV